MVLTVVYLNFIKILTKRENRVILVIEVEREVLCILHLCKIVLGSEAELCAFFVYRFQR